MNNYQLVKTNFQSMKNDLWMVISKEQIVISNLSLTIRNQITNDSTLIGKEQFVKKNQFYSVKQPEDDREDSVLSNKLWRNRL